MREYKEKAAICQQERHFVDAVYLLPFPVEIADPPGSIR